jgi:hypothetical protein
MEKQDKDLNVKKNVLVISALVCFIVFLISMTFLSSCTYSINMVHTQGEASDVIDEEQTPKTDISPDLTIPAL